MLLQLIVIYIAVVVVCILIPRQLVINYYDDIKQPRPKFPEYEMIPIGVVAIAVPLLTFLVFRDDVLFFYRIALLLMLTFGICSLFFGISDIKRKTQK